LVNHGAAILLPQSGLTTDSLLNTLSALLTDSSRLQAMSVATRQLAPVSATEQVATACLSAGGVQHG
jgi:UDP-N-acetylglucosamine:LPS N-acetylglucosamine transferase